MEKGGEPVYRVRGKQEDVTTYVVGEDSHEYRFAVAVEADDGTLYTVDPEIRVRRDGGPQAPCRSGDRSNDKGVEAASGRRSQPQGAAPRPGMRPVIPLQSWPETSVRSTAPRRTHRWPDTQRGPGLR